MNIWRQPVDGNPAKQITYFTEGSIAGFDVTRDEKKIICSRQLSDNFLAFIEDAK